MDRLEGSDVEIWERWGWRGWVVRRWKDEKSRRVVKW